jgi:Iron-containing redox enzyme
MFIAAHEWSSPLEPAARPGLSHKALAPASSEGMVRALYRGLARPAPDETARSEARFFLHQALRQVENDDCDLPASWQDLTAWMHNSAQLASAKYLSYLEERKAGGPRRYFQNRAHALYFLRGVAPTKLVDGAWLSGLLAHWQNPRFSQLIATYVEELGEGRADKNHVLLFRKLMASHGLESNNLPDNFYKQGVLQLALGLNAADFLPEVIGFNLGYEQLPLHLLITAYELNELGIDPYYFTLHVTVDNADTGHAQRAVQSVLDTLPGLGGSADFWRRVRNGSKLGDVGLGTTQVIAGFDLDREVEGIFARKSVSGLGAHSDYCRVAGRSVNDWLAQPDNMPGFLAALQQAGWIQRGLPVQENRFWKLLQGERAEMFGVFSPYELQLIHDWIRGPASADGQAYDEAVLPAGRRRATFRAASRLAERLPGISLESGVPNGAAAQRHEVLDADLQRLQSQLAATGDAAQKKHFLIPAMSAALHWTPAGLYATRQFLRLSA